MQKSKEEFVHVASLLALAGLLASGKWDPKGGPAPVAKAAKDYATALADAFGLKTEAQLDEEYRKRHEPPKAEP